MVRPELVHRMQINEAIVHYHKQNDASESSWLNLSLGSHKTSGKCCFFAMSYPTTSICSGKYLELLAITLFLFPLYLLCSSANFNDVEKADSPINFIAVNVG